MSWITDLRFALRSLARAKGLTITIVLTLALGIGANATIFSVVRGVLLRPLVNREAERLIYIRQSAPGIGVANAAFSVPELRDLRESVKSLTAFGDFSTIEFTMIGLGDPRTVRAGVVGRGDGEEPSIATTHCSSVAEEHKTCSNRSSARRIQTPGRMRLSSA